MTIDAVIFDINGVLVKNSRTYNEISFKKYISDNYNEKNLTDTIIDGCRRRPLIEQVKCWEKKLNISIDYNHFDKETTEMQLEMMRKEKKDPQLTLFLKYLRINNIQIAVATSSGRARAKKILQTLDYSYDVLVTSDDVGDGRSKPEQDIYLEAVKNLNYPTTVIAVEDSPKGITSAKSASQHLESLGITLKVIGYYRKDDPEHRDMLSDADATIADFSEIYASINRLFAEDIPIPRALSEAVS